MTGKHTSNSGFEAAMFPAYHPTHKYVVLLASSGIFSRMCSSTAAL